MKRKMSIIVKPTFCQANELTVYSCEYYSYQLLHLYDISRAFAINTKAFIAKTDSIYMEL